MKIEKIVTKLVTIILLSVSLSAMSEKDQYFPVMEVGQYDEKGEIQLNYDAFLTTFPDDVAIDELSVTSLNGFMHLHRKGYDNDGTCRAESLQLVTREGSPISTETMSQNSEEGDMVTYTETATMLVEKVYISSTFPTYSIDCLDNGCDKLKELDLGNSSISYSRCDVSDESGNKCRCHFTRDSTNHVIEEGMLCTSIINSFPTNIFHWLKPLPISTIDDEAQE